MWSTFLENTRCPDTVVSALTGLDPGVVRAAAPLEAVAALGADLPENPGAVVDALRLEHYQAASPGGRSTAAGSGSPVRRAYYMIRPLLPVSVRKHLQRTALRGWERIPFPAWPVDTSVEDIFAEIWSGLLSVTGRERLPFIWYWPNGHDFAAILTHDVETSAGRDFSGELMAMEAQVGLHSAFEIVPEERYEVPAEYLAQIRAAGCEVCVHGLNHDGHLFDNEEMFARRAIRINEYLRDWGARGFRSPIMYRRQDWLHHLAVEYDMSVPNTARLDPQRGGCCTIMPYFAGDVLELPQTTIQDYSLLAVLNDASPRIWWDQLGIIADRGGLASFIVHPDYMIENRARDLYRTLLNRLALLRDDHRAWLALPGEVNDWWRQRHEMKLVEVEGRWRVTGEGADRARVAWAVRDGEGIRFEVDP